jgi:farnesyl diphosphate synthase
MGLAQDPFVAITSNSTLDTRLSSTARLVEQQLNAFLPADGTRLREAVRYSILGGGKRLRPFLVMEVNSMLGGKALDAMRLGAALECVHCYSLVHDDLPAMDNDDLRRGQPTVHRKFDEATAILAGDALLTFAFEIIAHAKTHPDGTVRSRLVLELAKAAGEAGMVGGQMLDIEAETRNFASLEDISTMQRGKTGALFRFACESPAIAMDHDPAALRQYAEHIGLAFQIADDILDVESNAAALGKATQKDKARGKATFVDFLGLDGAKAEAKRLCAAAQDSLAGYGARADTLRAVAAYIITREK